MKLNKVLLILAIIIFIAFTGVVALNKAVTSERDYYKDQLMTTCNIINTQVDQINILIEGNGLEIEKSKKIECDSLLLRGENGI